MLDAALYCSMMFLAVWIDILSNMCLVAYSAVTGSYAITKRRWLSLHIAVRITHPGVFLCSRTDIKYVDKIMGLADTLIVLEDGAITETGSPTTLLQGDGYTSKLGITALSDDVDDDAKADIKKGLKNVCPDLDSPIVLESSRTSKDTDETDKELPDLRRKNGDFAVYKYYIANAGYAAVFLYTIFITLWMFCTEFSSKYRGIRFSTTVKLTDRLAVIIKWWSEANAVEPNQQLGMWIGLYAMLGVLGTVGAAVAAW